MLINQVIDMARGGELSNLSEDSITDAKVLGYINLGLIELHKRFALRTDEAIITMSVGGASSDTLYRVDTTDTRVQMSAEYDILTIQEAYDEEGSRLRLNVEDDDLGIMTPSFDTVQIPNPSDGERIAIVYTTGPKYVTAVTDRLAAPISLLEALLHYVGYRAHGSIDGALAAENNSHYQRFEASIKNAITLGLVAPDNIAARDVSKKGFI